MGLKSGDKAKYYRERRKRNVRRAAMRALRAALKSQTTDKSATPTPT
ncbi:MAG TPA: hypothetical protein VL403_08885 [Candidatus Kryptonia bacterium]|nr:hypothetical protein [Candidatus Kryptonia bacterium]